MCDIRRGKTKYRGLFSPFGQSLTPTPLFGPYVVATVALKYDK